MKTIKIACKGVGTVSLNEIEPIQGDLKNLSKENFEKLKLKIIKHGYTAPFFLWKDPSKKKWSILDGTQRDRVLIEMQKDGYDIPPLPYVEVFANTLAEAKRILLTYVSQFGKVDPQGLYQYSIEGEFSSDELDEYAIPDVDMAAFKEEFFDIAPKEVDLPDLPSSDPDCQQITFILSNEQKDILDEALEKAKKSEDCSDGINQNSNGNALAAILKHYVYG